MEVVLPIEVQIPSLRIMKDAGLNEDDWIQTRLDQLSLIDEKRLTAVCHGQMYQKQMIKAFKKKVRRQVYQVGDLVIKHIILSQGDPRGKWTPTYAPDTEAILMLIQTQLLIKFRYTPDKDSILILIQIQLLRYSSDTLQTWMPL